MTFNAVTQVFVSEGFPYIRVRNSFIPLLLGFTCLPTSSAPSYGNLLLLSQSPPQRAPVFAPNLYRPPSHPAQAGPPSISSERFPADQPAEYSLVLSPNLMCQSHPMAPSGTLWMPQEESHTSVPHAASGCRCSMCLSDPQHVSEWSCLRTQHAKPRAPELPLCILAGFYPHSSRASAPIGLALLQPNLPNKGPVTWDVLWSPPRVTAQRSRFSLTIYPQRPHLASCSGVLSIIS